MASAQVLWIGSSNGLPPGWPAPAASWEIVFEPPARGIAILSRVSFAAVVLERGASQLLPSVQQIAVDVPLLIYDPAAAPSEIARFTRLGARQFLTTSARESFAAIDEAVNGASTGLARLSDRVSGAEWEHLLVGDSPEMRMVHQTIRLVASRRATVLISGETGTGKELAARALHLAGNRSTGPWIAVNCSALPETLLESELFGHVRGAFTGAIQSRAGRFEQAQGGTIFLDEIGELPMELQAKLLRVLQEREVQRLGGSEAVRLDIRVVAATNRDLDARVHEGKFREDLYYRLNVVPIEMPPLRRRPSDIALLADHFVQKICRAEGIAMKTIARDGLERLRMHSWPGNVRQLENAIEMAIALGGDRTTLGASDFPVPAVEAARLTDAASVVDVPDCGLDYEQTLAVIERSILEQALRKTGGNKKAAAEMLRLKRTTLSAKVRSLEAVA
jgi:DNA-binding NtrC family response regulator